MLILPVLVTSTIFYAYVDVHICWTHMDQLKLQGSPSYFNLIKKSISKMLLEKYKNCKVFSDKLCDDITRRNGY